MTNPNHSLPQTDPDTPEFRVHWEIDVAAPNAVEAARSALATQRDPSSTATVFDVTAHGVTHRVDLLDPEAVEVNTVPAEDVAALRARIRGLETVLAIVRADVTARANHVVPYQDGSAEDYADHLVDLIAETSDRHGVTVTDQPASTETGDGEVTS